MDVSKQNYISRLLNGIGSLLTGLKVTGKEFFTKKTTEEYPENRDSLVMFDRYRGTLCMPHDEVGANACIACGLCELNCPNGSIELLVDSITDPATEKKKKVLMEYRYNLGSCMFCLLCVNVCPTKAIRFDTDFEHAVFTKDKLIKLLHKE